MRGRLIFSFLADIRRLDSRVMALEPGFDEDFKEPALLDLDGDGLDDRLRQELPSVMIPCQVEPHTFEQLQMRAGGDSPRSDLGLLFHFRDLKRLSLVDPSTGSALLRPNDRLAGLYDSQGQLIQAIRTPPGLYIDQAQPRGFGLGRGRPQRNLLLVTFKAQQLSPMRVQ